MAAHHPRLVDPNLSPKPVSVTEMSNILPKVLRYFMGWVWLQTLWITGTSAAR